MPITTSGLSKNIKGEPRAIQNYVNIQGFSPHNAELQSSGGRARETSKEQIDADHGANTQRATYCEHGFSWARD